MEKYLVIIYYSLLIGLLFSLLFILGKSSLKKETLDKHLVQKLLSLSPGNLSIIVAMCQNNDGEDNQIGTGKGSENDIFYSFLAECGYAENVPLEGDFSPEVLEVMQNIKSYRLTPKGRQTLKEILKTIGAQREMAVKSDGR